MERRHEQGCSKIFKRDRLQYQFAADAFKPVNTVNYMTFLFGDNRRYDRVETQTSLGLGNKTISLPGRSGRRYRPPMNADERR